MSIEMPGTAGEIVMPFVVCKSHGGPYDDEAFVAGCYFTEWETRLALGDPAVATGMAPRRLVPQLDLLAMHHGYDFEADLEEPDSDDFVFVVFSMPIEEEEEEPEE